MDTNWGEPLIISKKFVFFYNARLFFSDKGHQAQSESKDNI